MVFDWSFLLFKLQRVYIYRLTIKKINSTKDVLSFSKASLSENKITWFILTLALHCY